jgi:predicted nucleotidyltransferase component of viral defense system
MATLNPVHWNTVSDEMRAAFAWLAVQTFLSRFYLAGGTALALRLGHRRSVDLDFFSASDELLDPSRREIISAFEHAGGVLIENAPGNLVLELKGVRTGFFSYGYALLNELDNAEGLPVASLLDGGLMKIDAIIGRGSRKDFYDLYEVLKHIPLEILLTQASTKYPHYRDFAMLALENLVLFDKADRERQPDLVTLYPWYEVRAFFIAEAKRLVNRWFDIQEEN